MCHMLWPICRGTISERFWTRLGQRRRGSPYLFISVAVESYSPAAVVAGRTLLGAVLLLPFAIRQKAPRPAFTKIGWVLLFGAIEMAGPFLLLGHAEQTLPSGLTGLLVATVPLFATIIAFGGGDRPVLSPARSIGLFAGFVGVFVMIAGPGLAVEGGMVSSRSAKSCWPRYCMRSRRSSSRPSCARCPRSAPYPSRSSP
jgi:drug/metabolite transporter (DMT)-like permease